MRLLKGQEMLPDGSTLEENGIPDGSTINIVIEPDKEINLRVRFGLEVFSWKLKTSRSVKYLKQCMIEADQVALVQEDFDLVQISYAEKIVLESSLPLHHYALTDGVVLEVRLAFLRLNIEQVSSSIEWTRKMSRSATVKELKHVITMEICEKKGTEICVYYQGTKKLGDTQVLGNVVKGEMDRLIFVENKSFKHFRLVFYKGRSLGCIGVENTDTHEDMRYRAQDQLGVPFKKIHVKTKKPHHWNRIDGYVIEVEKRQNISDGDNQRMHCLSTPVT